jgi:iron complex outermembrane receptor protein
MKIVFSIFSVFLLSIRVFSQTAVPEKKQTDSVLQGVTVTAFHSDMQWKAVPAAVALIKTNDLNRYGNLSPVPILNAIPGIRMEERSPASYRLSVRGSLLRSPFGVRNTKVYWNGIPLSDAGGNTYLNLVDMGRLQSAEIVKGPAASSYGAGTGGALLLQSSLLFSEKTEHHFHAAVSGGSYGLFAERAGAQFSNKTYASSIEQTHQQADGYREQSASRKDIIKWQLVVQAKKQQFHFLFFYTDLYYQTPGGITLAQMQADPKLSRQAAGNFPGAIQQKAAIYNKTIFGGVHHQAALSANLLTESFVMVNHTGFTNPFITNYEKRNENNLGAGFNLVYKTKPAENAFKWVNGIEWLYNHSAINDFGNRNGQPDTVQFKDVITATQWFAFSQMQLSLNAKWVLTAGISLNNQLYSYERLTDPNPLTVHKKIDLVVTPRIALLYRLNQAVSFYLLAAKGFSPPAIAEIRPSDGNYYGNLDAESGWNIETGFKGDLVNNRLQFDIAAYFFRLQQAIVRRTNLSGAEYFVNAGGTKQNGIEALIKYTAIKNQNKFIRTGTFWSSYSFQPYRFSNYQQSGVDYSGNSITGVPRNILVSGVDLETANHCYLNVSINAVSSLPLTDANDVYADACQLLQCKIGCRMQQDKLDIFIGADNLLNQVYSLGNDINAPGKRYYNPAPGRNFFCGFRWDL